MATRLIVYGLAGAAIMAGIAMLRRVRFERGRLRPGIPGQDEARRRLRRITVFAFICLACGIGIFALLLLDPTNAG